MCLYGKLSIGWGILILIELVRYNLCYFIWLPQCWNFIKKFHDKALKKIHFFFFWNFELLCQMRSSIIMWSSVWELILLGYFISVVSEEFCFCFKYNRGILLIWSYFIVFFDLTPFSHLASIYYKLHTAIYNIYVWMILKCCTFGLFFGATSWFRWEWILL